MPETIMFHDGNRTLQDQFDSRRIADRLEEKLTRRRLTPQDQAFIERSMFFFLATADGEGRPDCSFKGGSPGFVRVIAPDEIAFPDYDGNGMFKSLGNILANPAVGLLFIDMGEKPRRLRVNGEARVSRDDPLMQRFAGAQLLVRVKTRAIFPNCPRYIVTPGAEEPSKYSPRPDYQPPEPAWKGFDDFKDFVHPRQPTPNGGAMRVSLRQALPEDFDYCARLYFDGMDEIIRVLGLDRARQMASLREGWRPGEARIIASDETDVGWLQSEIQDDALFLAQLFVDGSCRGKGIGTTVMARLIAEATEACRPMGLAVVKINPARRLYERLGFRITHSDEHKYYMTRSMNA